MKKKDRSNSGLVKMLRFSNHRTFLIFLKVILSLLLLMVGCQQETPSPDWFRKWLDNETCLPPCWMNIIPGSTTFQKAYSILNTDPGVYIRSTSKGEENERSQIGVTWKETPFSATITALSGSENAKVDRIDISINQMLSVRQAFSYFGIPDYIQIDYPCFGELFSSICGVDLLYLKDGIVLQLGIKSGVSPDKIKISENSSINGISLIEPGISSYLVSMNRFRYEELTDGDFIPWEGYGYYPVNGSD